MTKEELIRYGKDYLCDLVMSCYEEISDIHKEFVIEAIKALEQEPSKDCISRQSVKDGMIKYGFLSPDMTVTEFVEDVLQPVTPTRMKGKWGDYIDRAEFLKRIEPYNTPDKTDKALYNFALNKMMETPTADVVEREKYDALKSWNKVYQRQIESACNRINELDKLNGDMRYKIDKIRAEIIKKHLSIIEKNDFDSGRTYNCEEVLDIIDKYKTEMENKK